MRPIIILLLCCTCFASMAQTKKIAFKSHSGSAENFSVALENDLFDMDNSNFGVAPTELVQYAQLDSVIFICDSVAVMITSQYCTRVMRHSNQPQGASNLWQPGRAEIKNHPLFSKQHSLDSIKKVIRTQYNFRNPVEKVVFIGYDNSKLITKNKKKTVEVRGDIVPLFTPGNTGNGTGGWIVAGILAASLLGGALSWRIYTARERKAERLVWLRA